MDKAHQKARSIPHFGRRGLHTAAVANGQDANPNWFYLRPGAVQFLLDLIETLSVRIDMVTQMKHSNCTDVDAVRAYARECWGTTRMRSDWWCYKMTLT